MIKTIKIFSGVLILILLSPKIFSQWGEESITEGSYQGLKLEIELSKTSYLIGEPVIITCKLINVSKDTIWLKEGINGVLQGRSNIGIDIRPPSGKTERFFSSYSELRAAPPPKKYVKENYIMILPGGYVYDKVELLFGQFKHIPDTSRPWIEESRYCITTDPGQYNIWVTYGCGYQFSPKWLWKGMLRSAPKCFVASKPQGDDRSALKELEKIKDFYSQFGAMHGMMKAEDGSVFKQMREKYLSTVIGPYGRYQYAGYLWRQKHDLNGAIKEYESVIKDCPNFIYSEEAALYLPFVYKELSDVKKAQELFRQAIEKYPHHLPLSYNFLESQYKEMLQLTKPR